MSKQEQRASFDRSRTLEQSLDKISPEEWAAAIEARDNDQQEPQGAKYPVKRGTPAKPKK